MNIHTPYKHISGMTIIEIVIAVSVFLVLVLAMNVTLSRLASSHTEVIQTYQAQMLAKNGIKIATALLEEQSSALREVYAQTFIGTPAFTSLRLRWNGEFNAARKEEINQASVDADLVAVYDQLIGRYILDTDRDSFLAYSYIEKEAYLESMLLVYDGYEIIPNIIILSEQASNSELLSLFRYIDDSYVIGMSEATFSALSQTDRRTALQAIWNEVKGGSLDSDPEFESNITVHALSGGYFYRTIQLTKIEDWGLYEMEAKVCYEDCDAPYSLYSIIQL